MYFNKNRNMHIWNDGAIFIGFCFSHTVFLMINQGFFDSMRMFWLSEAILIFIQVQGSLWCIYKAVHGEPAWRSSRLLLAFLFCCYVQQRILSGCRLPESDNLDTWTCNLRAQARLTLRHSTVLEDMSSSVIGTQQEESGLVLWTGNASQRLEGINSRWPREEREPF